MTGKLLIVNQGREKCGAGPRTLNVRDSLSGRRAEWVGAQSAEFRASPGVSGVTDEGRETHYARSAPKIATRSSAGGSDAEINAFCRTHECQLRAGAGFETDSSAAAADRRWPAADASAQRPKDHAGVRRR